MAVLMPIGIRQYLDANGDPLVGGSVAFAQPGTGGSTLSPVWADEDQTIPLHNPVPLNAAGQPFSGGSAVSIWGSGAYEEIVKNAIGSTISTATIDTRDFITGGTLSGDLVIDGSLEVTGNILGDTQINTPSLYGTDGAISTDFAVGRNLNVGGNLGVQGGTEITNGATIDTLNVTGNATIAPSGTLETGNIAAVAVAGTTALFNTMNMQGGEIFNLNVANLGWPTLYAGTAITGADGHVTVALAAGFNFPPVVVATYVGPSGVVAGSGAAPIAISNITTTGFDVYTEMSLANTGSGIGNGGGTEGAGNGGQNIGTEGPSTADSGGGGALAAALRDIIPVATPRAVTGISMKFLWIAVGV
jgi:hypothetical protein